MSDIEQPQQETIPPQPEPASVVEHAPAPPAEPTPVLVQPPILQPPSQSIFPSPKALLTKALESIQFRKKAKLEKIMKMATEKKVITNDQVEKLLHVSDATATRYLAELVKQNKLRRAGLPQNQRYEPLN